ncbi:MAG: TetR/AcrR family transcriptional regulator [Flavobacteriales bacterium]
MEEKEKGIILGATEVFMRLGIKSVNMDDISRQLGISKKTLYKYVSDKNDLVHKSVLIMMDLEDEAIEDIQSRDLNAIDENMEIMKHAMGMLNNMHPSIMFDMEKYHPTILRSMMDNRHSKIYDCVMSNLKQGITEGLYRKNLNADVIAKMSINSMDVILDKTEIHIEGISFSEKFKEYFRYHIRGIASEKGITYLKENYSKS